MWDRAYVGLNARFAPFYSQIIAIAHDENGGRVKQMELAALSSLYLYHFIATTILDITASMLRLGDYSVMLTESFSQFQSERSMSGLASS